MDGKLLVIGYDNWNTDNLVLLLDYTKTSQLSNQEHCPNNVVLSQFEFTQMFVCRGLDVDTIEIFDKQKQGNESILPIEATFLPKIVVSIEFFNLLVMDVIMNITINRR